MNPLEQWICDSCDLTIENVDDGFLEWYGDENSGKEAGFRIVHNSNNCFKYTKHEYRKDNHLGLFVGDNGIIMLLSFLDLGPFHDPNGEHVPRVSNIREFVEITRRLTVPYYEEARTYWNTAKDDGFFIEANEIAIYMPDTLKRIIEKYGSG